MGRLSVRSEAMWGRFAVFVAVLAVAACSKAPDPPAAAPVPVDPQVAQVRAQFDGLPGMKPFLDVLAREGVLDDPEVVPRVVAYFQSDCGSRQRFSRPPQADVAVQRQLKLYFDVGVGLERVHRIQAAEDELCKAGQTTP